MMLTYTQTIKKQVRHTVVKKAITNITTKRDEASVISKDYVRNIYDYYSNLEEESPTKNEVNEIDTKFIQDWERLHESINSTKTVSELNVCYLCGPEPENDFKELIDFGVLPQNIWAFEMDSGTYKLALSNYDEKNYPQPKIVKQKLENFFKYTPKKFDIVYIDACASIPSDKHALKCVKDLFQYGRLNSPGELITNFATPDNPVDIGDYVMLISMYLYFRSDSSSLFKVVDNKIENVEFSKFKKKVENSFENYYSEFVSMVIRDLGSFLIPIQRIKENPYFNQLYENFKPKFDYQKLFEMSKYNGIAKFMFSAKYLKQERNSFKKLDQFLDEIGNFDDICYGLEFIVRLHNAQNNYSKEITSTLEYFENGNAHQFLDKVHINMYYDIVIYQLTYPMHYNNKQNYRCFYTAKSKKMMLDVTIFDECRYLYEWLPTMHQILYSFKNKSWQYVFRFALDGLVKSRKQNNNELFFQGSVISDRIHDFECIKVPKRNKKGRK